MIPTEVDVETGVVRLLKYVAVDDGWRVINPLVVEGPVQGGSRSPERGGQALTECIVYDEGGQLLTSTLSDYLIPSAEMLPDIGWDRTETPNFFANPIGVKGIEETETIPATPRSRMHSQGMASRYARLTQLRMGVLLKSARTGD